MIWYDNISYHVIWQYRLWYHIISFWGSSSIGVNTRSHAWCLPIHNEYPCKHPQLRPRFASPRPASGSRESHRDHYHIIPCHAIPYDMRWYDIACYVWYHIKSSDMTWYHIISYHLIAPHNISDQNISYEMPWHIAKWYNTIWSAIIHMLWDHALSYAMISYHTISHYIIWYDHIIAYYIMLYDMIWPDMPCYHII